MVSVIVVFISLFFLVICKKDTLITISWHTKEEDCKKGVKGEKRETYIEGKCLMKGTVEFSCDRTTAGSAKMSLFNNSKIHNCKGSPYAIDAIGNCEKDERTNDMYVTIDGCGSELTWYVVLLVSIFVVVLPFCWCGVIIVCVTIYENIRYYYGNIDDDEAIKPFIPFPFIDKQREELRKRRKRADNNNDDESSGEEEQNENYKQMIEDDDDDELEEHNVGFTDEVLGGVEDIDDEDD